MTKARAAITPCAIKTVWTFPWADAPRLLSGSSGQELSDSRFEKPPVGKELGNPWPQKPLGAEPPNGPLPPLPEVEDDPPLDVGVPLFDPWVHPLLLELPDDEEDPLLLVVDVPLLEVKGLTSDPPLAFELKLKVP